MKQYFRIFSATFVLMHYVIPLGAVTVGSDTAVTYLVASVTLNNGDIVAAFPFLSAGFTLSSAAVSATVRTSFPVGGTVGLNGGTMILGHDLDFLNKTLISSIGNITANGFAMSLSSNSVIPTVVPGSIICYTWKDIKLVLNADLTLRNSCIMFEGVSTILGQGHKLTLAPTCTLQIKNRSSLLLKDIIVDGINSKKIACLDTKSTLSLEAVEWIQNGNYTFDKGKFEVLGSWVLAGENRRFSYETNQQSTIGQYGVIEFSPFFTFSYKPSIARSDLIACAAGTAQLILNGATLHSSTTGIRLTRGIFTIDDHSSLASDAVVKAQGIFFGDGVQKSNNLTVNWLAEAGINLTSGFLVYANI